MSHKVRGGGGVADERACFDTVGIFVLCIGSLRSVLVAKVLFCSGESTVAVVVRTPSHVVSQIHLYHI